LIVSNKESRLPAKKLFESKNVTLLLIVIAMNFSPDFGITLTLFSSGNIELLKYGRIRCESYPMMDMHIEYKIPPLN